MFRFAAITIALLHILLTPTQSVAQSTSDRAFQRWLAEDVWPAAQKAGISRKTFSAATKDLTPDRTIPDLAGSKSGKQRQSEFRAPGRYFSQRSINGLAKTGAGLLRRHRSVLSRITKRTGVPGPVIVAIWGRESGFGRVKLPKNAIRALATSAFMGRRKELFRAEFIAALNIVEKGHVSAGQMRSSWAGALGQPQFLPSKFFDYAVDEDGDGRRDIWGSVPDTLGSIGNYLAKFGWQRGRDWGYEAVVPQAVSCSLGGPDQGRKFKKWIADGVKRVSGKPFPRIELNGTGYLLFPGGRYGPTFLVTPNFYVLKKYNESDVYALFVGHLADRMVGGRRFATAWQELPSFSRSSVQAMQEKLVAMGYDVGGADGLVGYKTRNAIGLWQLKNNLRATCFPSAKLVRELK